MAATNFPALALIVVMFWSSCVLGDLEHKRSSKLTRGEPKVSEAAKDDIHDEKVGQTIGFEAGKWRRSEAKLNEMSAATPKSRIGYGVKPIEVNLPVPDKTYGKDAQVPYFRTTEDNSGQGFIRNKTKPGAEQPYGNRLDQAGVPESEQMYRPRWGQSSGQQHVSGNGQMNEPGLGQKHEPSLPHVPVITGEHKHEQSRRFKLENPQKLEEVPSLEQSYSSQLAKKYNAPAHVIQSRKAPLAGGREIAFPNWRFYRPGSVGAEITGRSFEFENLQLPEEDLNSAHVLPESVKHYGPVVYEVPVVNFVPPQHPWYHSLFNLFGR